MRNKFTLTCVLKRTAAFCLVPALLSSCTMKTVVAEPSKTVGVARAAELVLKDAQRVEIVPEGQITVADDQPPLDNKENTAGNTDSAGSSGSAGSGGVSWTYANGKYTYNFPEPDRSTLSDLTDINNTPKDFFSDVAPEDTGGTWYFGKTEYNESTGESTIVWDRSADTLALLDEYGGIYRGDTSRKVCYFTFDCGYENGYTDKIMDTLREKGVSGTFFVTGAYVDSAKPQIQRMIEEGHIIGNHTNNHPNMAKATAQEFISEIEGLEKKVKDAFPDSQPILYYRPPEGATSEWALKMADKMGLRTVLWSCTYRDFDTENQWTYSDALTKLKSGLHEGCVYLLHAVSSTNAAILGELIDWIRAQGYEILPLCDIDVGN